MRYKPMPNMFWVRKLFPKYFLFLGVTTVAAAALSIGAGIDLIHQAELLKSA